MKYCKSHLSWLLVNMLIYGYNDMSFGMDRLSEFHQRAQWYADVLCGSKGILHNIGSGYCVPRILTPQQIFQRTGLNASYVLKEKDPPILLVKNFLSHAEANSLIRRARQLGVDSDDAIGGVDGSKTDLKFRSNTRVGGQRPPSQASDRWQPLDAEYILHSARDKLALVDDDD